MSWLQLLEKLFTLMDTHTDIFNKIEKLKVLVELDQSESLVHLDKKSLTIFGS